MKTKEQELFALCKAFIEQHNITCPETVYQVDSVIVDAYGLIEGICDIVGYIEEDQDE